MFYNVPLFSVKSAFCINFMASILLIKLIIPRNNQIKHIDRYLKNGISKSIVHVIRHANFQLYRVYLTELSRKLDN